MSDSVSKSLKKNLVKMLLTTVPTISTTLTNNSGLLSPNDEIIDENPNKLINYLHQIAGNYEIELNVIMKDHCYARPWNWKPENVYVKPVRNLFFPKTQNAITKDNVKQEEFINIEDSDLEPTTPPFDLTKIRQTMDEFQRVANFVRSEDPDDWEEKIDKILWSPVQNRIFSRTVRILNSERVARLAKVNSLYEPILRRSSIDMTSKRFRETLASANWDWRISQWLHSLLFDYLPQEYLAIYLDILQTLRQKVPQLIDKMIAVQPNINSKGSSVTWETLGPLLKKSWDPIGPALNASRPKKLPGNPILIIVPNGMSSLMSSRQHRWITQLGTLGMVVTVNPHLGLIANKMTVIAGIEQLIQACRAKIQDIRVDFPGRPIILVGFKTGAALACQIGQLEHVTAIVCLGFPFNTVDGKRGAPDDTLLDVRCPVIFVIGQNSMLARVDDIEDLREHMLVPTSLIVVGSADDYLRIPTSKKISEKISQSMVDRCILDEIGDFVGGILLQPHPLPLRSPNSINNYESRGKRGDVRKRKNSTSSSVESEPQSPNLKKLRSHSPQQAIVTANNITGIQANVLTRGTLVALTGTTSIQTPRKKSRVPFVNQGFPDQLLTSRLTTQQQNLDSSTGGITLNIGSFASLAPVGPIRFEPTSISLQTPAAIKTNNTLKASNAFIKVSKNSQMNIAGAQNIAKIKMIMPTKKTTQRTVGNNYKNISIGDKTINMNMVNVLTPNTTALRINPSAKTVTNLKATTGNMNASPLPSIHATKSTVNSNGTIIGKPLSSSSILFTPQNSFITSTTTTTTPTTPTKESDTSVADCNKKYAMFRSYNQDQLQSNNSSSSLTSLPEISKMRLSKNQAMSKISLQELSKVSSQSIVQNTEKNFKICSRSNNSTLEYSPTSRANSNENLDDDLGNILDIPIIIAKDDENLNNFDKLPVLPQTGITLNSDGKSLPINTVGNKVVFINNRNITSSTEFQQSQPLNQIVPTRTKSSVTLNRGILTASVQPTIKYTKIILTKRNDQEDKNSSVILAKTNKQSNKLLVIDSNNDIKYTQGNTRITDNYLNESKKSIKIENLNITDHQHDTNIFNVKPFIELKVENIKNS